MAATMTAAALLNISLGVNDIAPAVPENEISINLLMKWDLLQRFTV